MPAIGSFLGDTNALIALFRGDVRLSEKAAGGELFLPGPALAELFYGAHHSQRAVENLRILEGFLTGKRVLGCGVAVARWYGEIKAALRSKGRPIPENEHLDRRDRAGASVGGVEPGCALPVC